MVESYQAQLNQVGWSLCTLAIIVTIGRCYCRLWVLKRFGWDDGFMVFAMAAGIACAALVSAGVHYGYGLHLADITDEYNREQALKYTFIAPAISVVSSTTGKISMVFFLIRLLGHSAKRRHRWFLFSVTGIMIALNIFVIGVLLGQCTPMEKSWKPQVKGTCLHPGFLDYGGRIQAIWNAIMDLVTAMFPAYMVWRLQMKNSTKWGLTFLMGGGIFAAAATLVKVYYMRDLTKLTDVTYAWGPISIWYMAEIFVLIIAGTIPTLKPIWSQIRGKMPSVGSYVGSRKYRDHSSNYPYGGSKSGEVHTAGSKASKGFERRPGSVTIALNEIDDITKREAGSSTESILQKNKIEPSTVLDGQHSASVGVGSSRNGSPPHSPRAEHYADATSNTQPAIHVEQDFSVSYSKNDIERPTVPKHYRFP